MNKKLPEMFKNNIDKSHLNNKEVCYVSKEKVVKSNSDNTETVEEKIKKLFKSSKYVFNIGVIIKTKKKTYDTKVIGKIKNSLITEDNETIPIIEIEDIIIKDR